MKILCFAEVDEEPIWQWTLDTADLCPISAGRTSLLSTWPVSHVCDELLGVCVEV